MSQRCQICGPNKQEAPTVICAPCALLAGGQYAAGDITQSDDGRLTIKIVMLIPDGVLDSVTEVDGTR